MPKNKLKYKGGLKATLHQVGGVAAYNQNLKNLLSGLSGGNMDFNSALNAEGADKARNMNSATDLTISNGFNMNTPKTPSLGDTPIVNKQISLPDISNSTKPPSTGFGLGNITGALGGITGGVTSLFDIQNNKSLNLDQKRMQTGDAAVNTVANVAKAFGPWGTVIGTGLQAINSIGGSLMGTPKELKDFKVNDDVAKSSAYTGVAADASSVANSASTYQHSGLAGKLFGNAGKLVGEAEGSNAAQSYTKQILDRGNLAKDSAQASSDMFSTRNTMKLQNGSMWNNGSVQFGKEGTSIEIKPENKGKFTATKKATGETTEELTHSKDPVTRKRAIFAQNAKKWHHEQGGKVNIITHDIITNFLDNRSPWTKKKKKQSGGALTEQGNPGGNSAGNYEDGGQIETYKKLVGNSKIYPIKQWALQVGPAPINPAKDIVLPADTKVDKSITTFKDGGAINVIADGALHSQKHDLKDHPDFEDAAITHKGIPVVTIDGEGDVEQHAEVERDELILHIEVTKRLEELKKLSTDEAAIEAGRLLAIEIVRNTRDSKNKILKNG